ncbi:MAG: MBL fold metallo-hydrolase [Anaerolineae bacterium]
MQLQLIRNATLRLSYHNQTLLIDPFFAPKDAGDPLVGNARNPMVDLPLSIEDILHDVDLVIISHLHFDHFDPVAQAHLPKDLPILCQPGDEDKIREHGFSQVTPLTEAHSWQGITITRTAGEHGSGKWGERMGRVMGFVLQADDEPTLYWTGDTIWVDAVAERIQRHQPRVIVTHSCGAAFEAGSPIVMDAADTLRTCQTAPDATVIATHMEALDHATVDRATLRAAANDAGIPPERLRIPQDGDTLIL